MLLLVLARETNLGCYRAEKGCLFSNAACGAPRGTVDNLHGGDACE